MSVGGDKCQITHAVSVYNECPPRQLNGRYVETTVDSHLVGLHSPRTATAERKALDTMRGRGP